MKCRSVLKKIGEAAVRTVQDNPGGRFQKHPVGFIHLTGLEQEDAAAAVEPGVILRVDDQAIKLRVELLAIAGVLRIQDDQVNHQPAPAPVFMCLQ